MDLAIDPSQNVDEMTSDDAMIKKKLIMSFHNNYFGMILVSNALLLCYNLLKLQIKIHLKI